MSFQIAFDGTAAADLSALLRAAGDQLIHRSGSLMAEMDTQAQMLASATQKCNPAINCPTTVHIPHILLAFALGLFVGYLIGKYFASPAKPDVRG